MKTAVLLISLILIGSFVSAVPWPLDPVDEEHGIWHSYGQYVEAGGIHFHEGLDLPAENGTPVKAIKDGIVVYRLFAGPNPYAFYMIVQDADDESRGWSYVHMEIADRQDTNEDYAPGIWAVGDEIREGDVLGYVYEWVGSGVRSHLHLERNNDESGSLLNENNNPHFLDEDPLLLIEPREDSTSPVIDSDLLFRYGVDELGFGARYFDERVCGDVKVVKDNVDIIFEGKEIFGEFSEEVLSFHSLSFGVKKGDSVLFENEVFSFDDNFLGGNYSKFRNPMLAQIIYENDRTANSDDKIQSDGSFNIYYILTNSDEDLEIEESDRDRYWDTNAAGGREWNDLDESLRGEASGNFDAEFPDGLYSIDISASDENGNEVIVNGEVFVNNFNEEISVVESEEALRIAGEGFEANEDYQIYVFEEDLVNCGNLLDSEFVLDARSDGAGNLSLIIPGEIGNGAYNVVLDYDRNGIYSQSVLGENIDSFTNLVVERPRFLRGDVNEDGFVDVSDGIKILLSLFVGSELGCLDAADINDDGAVDISDSQYLFNYLFEGGPRPSEPFPEDGFDLTGDGLGC